MELLKAGVRENKRGTRDEGRKTRDVKNLIQRHLRPVPRVEWGRKLALSGCASSMIDVSDGLSSDLSHLCEDSGTGALLLSDRIPFSPALLRSADRLRKPPLDYALSGGEDYELLFTVPMTRMKTLEALRIPVTEIGMITVEKAMLQVNEAGKKIPLRPTGYNHFKGIKNRAKRSP
jgi:thiamine-monophosphate kinase